MHKGSQTTPGAPPRPGKGDLGTLTLDNNRTWPRVSNMLPVGTRVRYLLNRDWPLEL